MLRTILQEGITPQSLAKLVIYLIIILVSLSVHELFHGLVAYRCGDATARNYGRLTLNPLAHLDPIGAIMMLIFGFGYAKPVPINPRNFNHYKRDLCLVSLAGPVSNLLLALIGAVAMLVTLMLDPSIVYYNSTEGILLWVIGEAPGFAMSMWLFFCVNFTMANVSLFVFNLLPLPPLDGSRIVSVVLPGKYAYYYLKYERYIMLVVFALLYLNVLDGVLGFLAGHVHYGLIWGVEKLILPIINLF